MKSKKIIITTIILSIVVFYSLSLPVYAYELGGNGEYSIDKLVNVQYYDRTLGTLSVNTASLSVSPLEGSYVVTSSSLADTYQFDKYVNFQYTTPNDNNMEIPGGIGNSHFNILVRSDALNNSGHVFDINTIHFTFGMISYYGQTTPSDLGMQIVVYVKDGETITENISFSYEFGLAQAGVTPSGFEYFYRPVACTAHLDSGLKFDNDTQIAVLCRSYAMYAENNGNPFTFRYSLGMSPLYVTWKTDEEYVSGIGSTLNNVDKTLTNISSVLQSGMTAEQKERLEATTEKMEVIREQEEEIHEILVGLADETSFDFNANDFNDTLNTHVLPIYRDDGFDGFWEFLWGNGWIITAVLMVVSFAFTHYILFGVR